MKFTVVVKRFPGHGGWHYVEVPEENYQRFISESLIILGGFRSVPIRLKIGTTICETSIFPIRGGKKIIGINARVRKKENIRENSKITVYMESR